MSRPCDQAKLIQRIGAGEQDALRELYALYGQRMFAYALRLTQSRAQAEDVVQDALVAVWHGAGRYRHEGRPISWLLGIVHHTASKAMRHRHESLSERMVEALPSHEATPETQLDQDERAQRVRNGLNSLSAKHRSALELVFYHELSLAEAAQVCRCPLGTIKSRLSYARRKLRQVLEDWDD